MPCVTAKGLSPVNIANLGVILDVGTYDEIFGQCVAEHHEADDGESGVWNIPASVCQALRANSELGSIAIRWVATPELETDRWQESDGLNVLTRLADLLKGREDGQTLWYWWSLKQAIGLRESLRALRRA